jgi:integrase
MRWPGDPDGTRRNTAEGLVSVVLATLSTHKAERGRPDAKVLRLALRSYAFVPPTWDQAVPDDVAKALIWVADPSRPVTDLTDRDTAKEAVAALKVNNNGKPAAVKTAARRYSTLLSCMGYAVERKLLSSNPVTGVKLARNGRTVEEIDPRTVPSLAQARRLLDGAATLKTRNVDRAGHLAVYFAVMYYAGMRPSEVRGLRRADLDLPEEGWAARCWVKASRRTTASGSMTVSSSPVSPSSTGERARFGRWPFPRSSSRSCAHTSKCTALRPMAGSSSMARPAPPSPT